MTRYFKATAFGLTKIRSSQSREYHWCCVHRGSGDYCVWEFRKERRYAEDARRNYPNAEHVVVSVIECDRKGNPL